MSRPELIDEMAAEFDPADITTDWLRWTWHATDEIRQTLTKGEIRWQAVHRQLAAWHASGYLPIPLPAESQLSDLYLAANTGAAPWYGAKITRAAVAARLIAHGHNAILRGRSAAFDPDDDIAAIQAELDGVVRTNEQAELATIGELLSDSLVRAITEPTLEDRIPTGFIDLDSLLCGGWAPGQLVVVGARPAMGKTTLAQDFARAAAIANKIPTLIESLEMGKEELSPTASCARRRESRTTTSRRAPSPMSTWHVPPVAPPTSPSPHCTSTTLRSCRCRCCAARSAIWCGRSACAWRSSTTCN